MIPSLFQNVPIFSVFKNIFHFYFFFKILTFRAGFIRWYNDTAQWDCRAQQTSFQNLLLLLITEVPKPALLALPPPEKPVSKPAPKKTVQKIPDLKNPGKSLIPNRLGQKRKSTSELVPGPKRKARPEFVPESVSQKNVFFFN